jgi:hypothetical protein
LSNRSARVDHLVWCVPELQAGIAELEHLTGVTAVAGGSHPGVGTHNALVSLGPRMYLEIIAPDPLQDEYRSPRVFRLDEIRESTLVTWAATTDMLADLAATRFSDGQRLGDRRSLSRVRPDGIELKWTMTDPYTEIDHGIVPFLIDWGETPHPGDSAPPGISLVELRAWHPDPDAVLDKLARLGIDMPVEAGARPRLVAVLDTPTGRVDLG